MFVAVVNKYVTCPVRPRRSQSSRRLLCPQRRLRAGRAGHGTVGQCSESHSGRAIEGTGRRGLRTRGHGVIPLRFGTMWRRSKAPHGINGQITLASVDGVVPGIPWLIIPGGVASRLVLAGIPVPRSAGCAVSISRLRTIAQVPPLADAIVRQTASVKTPSLRNSALVALVSRLLK